MASQFTLTQAPKIETAYSDSGIFIFFNLNEIAEMSYTENKKERLIEWISSIENDSLLDFLNSIRLSQVENEEDWWDSISSDDKRNIQLGIEDYRKGEIIASEAFWRRFRNE